VTAVTSSNSKLITNTAHTGYVLGVNVWYVFLQQLALGAAAEEGVVDSVAGFCLGVDPVLGGQQTSQ